MPGLLLSAYQKFYSALNNLDKFNKENNFFDNISCLDTFFSEFRNITFVMQKSLAHTEYISAYARNRDRYLADSIWFVRKRNETTKEQPFQLIKQVEITLYYPNKGITLYSEIFSVDNNVEMSTLIEKFKRLFMNIDPFEVFFSAEFTFYEKDSQEDLFNKLIYGIQLMKDFLKSMKDEINEHCDLSEELIQKIDKLVFSQLPRDMLLISDYVYHPYKEEFERAGRVSLILMGQRKTINRTPLTSLKKGLFGNLGGDYFHKFVVMHAILQNVNLLPTMMVVFKDNTFELDAFNADIKTTIYRKINEVAKRIIEEDIAEFYYMQTYVACPYLLDNIKMKYQERLSLSENKYLTFMKVDCSLHEEEYIFDGANLSIMEYIIYQIKSGRKNTLSLGKTNMFPIVEAFRKRRDEYN